MFVEDKNNLAVRLVDGSQMLKFSSPKAETIFKETNAVISKWQNEKPVCINFELHGTFIVCTCVHYTPSGELYAC